MNRVFQTLLIVSTVALSWLLMMALHELGHLWHGWLSGARLAAVHLPLVGFSRTDFVVNPNPLFVVWGGPLWGCLLPLALWGGVRLLAKPYAYLAAWFAGFCLIANGGYLLGGAFLAGGADDGGVILQHGGARWQLLVFGVLAIAAGAASLERPRPIFWLRGESGQGRSQSRRGRDGYIGMRYPLVGISANGVG